MDGVLTAKRRCDGTVFGEELTRSRFPELRPVGHETSSLINGRVNTFPDKDGDANVATPAENWATYLNVAIPFTRYDPWGGVWSSTRSGQIANARKNRPASISNPVRGDGTRAPSSWYSEGAKYSAPKGTCVLRGLPGSGSTGYRWFVDHAECWNITNSDMGLPITSGFAFQNLENLAMQRCMSNLKDMKVNLGLFLAEIKRTSALIGSTATRMARALERDNRRLRGLKGRSLKRWKRLNRRRIALGRIDQKFLELCYGWAPLLADIYGSMEQLAEWQVNGERLSVTAHGFASDNSEAAIRPCAIYGIENSILVKVTQTDEVRVMVRADVPNVATSALASVGATNPLEIVWEMTRLSFVVDWLITIGSSISAVDAGVYLSFVEGSVTRFRKRYDPQFSPGSPPGYAVESIGSGGTFSSYAMYRRLIESMPVGIVPHLKLDLSVLQMVQGIALLTTAVSKRKEIISFLV